MNKNETNIGKFKLTLVKKAIMERKHLISVSVFQMRHSYRKITKYTNGLTKLANIVKEELPNFVLRIYYDKSMKYKSKLS